MTRTWSQRPAGAWLSAAVPCNRPAVEIARPALQQLAAALRDRESVRPQGVALSKLLLTEPSSALYHPAYSAELYEVARAALFALLPGGGTEGVDDRREGQELWTSSAMTVEDRR